MRRISLLIFIILGQFAGLLGCRETPEARYVRLEQEAKQYEQEERLQEARLTYANLIDLRPTEPKNYFELAQILARQKDLMAALATYKSVINLDPNHLGARLHIAALYLAAGQPELAEDHIRKALAQAPDNVEAQILNASLFRARNDFSRSRALLSSLLQLHPKNSIVLANLGELEIVEKNFPKAEEYLEQALEISPENQPIRLTLADLYATEGRLDDAQGLLDSIVKNDPKNSSLRLFFGEFLLNRGLRDVARTQYEEAVKADPKRWDARDKLYDLYLLRGEPARALALADDLVQRFPHEPGTAYFQARNAELRGQPREALLGYLRALEGMQTFSPVFRRTGILELAFGDRQLGIEHLRQALGNNEFDVGARLALGRDAFLQGEFGTALEHASRILSRYPRQMGANVLRADVLMLRNQLDEARYIYQRLTEAFPESPIGYFKLGLLEEQAKSWDAARVMFEKAMARDQKIIAPGRRLLSVMKAQQGWDAGYAKASEIYQAAKRDGGPALAQYAFLAGSYLLSKPDISEEELKQSELLLDEAISLRPELADAHVAKALILRQRQQLVEAAASFERAAAIEPRDVDVLMDLALTYEQLNDWEKAAGAYRRVLEADRRHGMAANNLAWLLVDKLNGNLDEAFERATIAKTIYPENPAVTDTLAWIYFKRGQYRAALALAEEALALDQKIRGESVAPPAELLQRIQQIRRAMESEHLSSSTTSTSSNPL